MTYIRLQKYLSMSGCCSRRKGEEYIQAGKVMVNGIAITEPGTKIDPDKDQIYLNDRLIHADEHLVYIILNKPSGYVTSCNQKQEKIVLELVDAGVRVFPVGRLDKESSGLLLLTNDGRIHHRLSHPSFNHEKEYEVRVDRPIPNWALERFMKGMPLMGGRTRPAFVRRISALSFQIVLKEGKNRQIRRMVRKIGNRIASLKRTRIANIQLGTLEEGKWRYLTRPEKNGLLKMIFKTDGRPVPDKIPQVQKTYEDPIEKRYKIRTQRRMKA